LLLLGLVLIALVALLFFMRQPACKAPEDATAAAPPAGASKEPPPPAAAPSIPYTPSMPPIPPSTGRPEFAGELIDQRVAPADTPGRQRRVRLVRTDFHYPILRVEEEIELDPRTGAVRVLSQNGMVGDHLLVKRAEGVSETEFEERLAELGYPIRRALRMAGVYQVEIPGASVDDLPRAIQTLTALKDLVAYAEPDHIMHAMPSVGDTP